MTNWDEGFWDSGHWDSQPAPPTRKRAMITLKTSILRLSRDEQYTKMETAKNGLKDHPTEYATPKVSVATLETNLAAAKAKLDKIKALEAELEAERGFCDAALQLCRSDYDQNAVYVVSVAQDDKALAALSGYDVAADPGASQPLGQLLNVVAATGDEDGELEVSAKKLTGAVSYEWQWAENPAGPWTHGGVSGVRTIELKPLPSLKKIWVRGRGIRGNEHGAWSDPACGMVS